MRRGFPASTADSRKPTADDIAAAIACMSLSANAACNQDRTVSTRKKKADPRKQVIDHLNSTPGQVKMMMFAKFPQPIPYLPDEPITTALLYEGTKEALWRRSTFLDAPFGFPPPSSSEWPFVIKDIPGLGKGMFAHEAIPPGKLILNEKILIISPVAFVYSPDRTVHPDRLSEVLIDRLDDKARKELYSLHNCKGTSCTKIRGIMDTNMLGIGSLPGPYEGEHGALCATLSRVNHSCSPNARYYYHLDTFSMSLCACQPIQKGEQIYISYMSTICSRKERQDELRAKYSFTCTCPTCQLPKKESQRSDIRRGLLRSAREQIEDGNILENAGNKDSVSKWALGSMSPNSVRLPDDHITKSSQRIMEMLEEENLTGDQAEDLGLYHCARLCMALCALGDREGVVKWARKGLEIAEAEAAPALGKKEVIGGRDAGVKMWKDLVVKPEGSMFWRLRPSV